MKEHEIYSISFCFIFDSCLFQIVYMSLTQRFHLDHLNEVMETAIKGCKDVGAILNEVVKSHLNRLGNSLKA